MNARTDTTKTHIRMLTLAVLVAILTLLDWSWKPLPAEAAQRRTETVYSPHLKRHLPIIRSQQLGRVLATWYGPGLWGNRTGCGSRLRTRTWGIAHRSLPCGRIVALRFNGRRIAVPVIDRGPFSGAEIDLTKRTADYLGFTSHGVGSVRVDVLRQSVPQGAY
jgi:rare lipoprotein A (peptidoglycan hydrolase)